MNALTIIGILLVIVGLVVLINEGITYTTHKKVLDIGTVDVTRAVHRTIPMPPIVGGLIMASGALLIFAGSTSGKT
jgi:hypothetical protein